VLLVVRFWYETNAPFAVRIALSTSSRTILASTSSSRFRCPDDASLGRYSSHFINTFPGPPFPPADLSPLKGPRTRLDLSVYGQVSDLSPLQGMPLTVGSELAISVKHDESWSA
jgi:hypothetical protein